MNILEIFRKKSVFFYARLILVGLVNSAFYSGLLIFINDAISGKRNLVPANIGWLVFSIFILLSFFISKLFQSYLIRLSFEIMADYELLLIDKLRKVGLEKFEKLGEEKVYSAIADTRILSRLPEVFINSVNSFVIICCCLFYLFYESYLIGSSILVALLGLLFIYLFNNKSIEGKMNVARDLQNDYYRYLKDLLFGFRDIKMSSKRNAILFDNYIRQNRLKGKEIGIKTSINYLNNELFGSYSWYIILGMLIFVLPKLSTIDPQQITIFIVTILYMISPVATLILLVPFYTEVKIALERVNEIFSFFSEPVHEDLGKGETRTFEKFKELHIDNVYYEYNDKFSERNFTLGPLSLTINKGEILFITGGNGSGKSTFLSLITGLYQPKSGSLYYNGKEINPVNLKDLSDSISAIFTTNYLFCENYNDFDFTRNQDVNQNYLQELNIADVVKIDKSIFEARLSKGQQKRLAMLFALMEDKEIMVFDEWAAEQDPHYRQYFYEFFLPKLRDSGKTIIAVTHDDKYFSQADRIIKFECGIIVADYPASPSTISTL